MNEQNSQKQSSKRFLKLWGFLSYLAVVCAAPYYLIRIILAKKYRAGLRQRLTLYSLDEIKRLQNGPYLWIHTVSVGELQAARPLLKRLKQEYAECKLLVTTVTETGQQLAHSLPEIDAAFYLPLDLYPLCRHLTALARPVCVLIFETEIWPNLIRMISSQNIPFFLVNARISDRSFGRYHFFRFFFAPLLNLFTAILSQSEEDAARFMRIGAPSEKVHAIGNIKFDAVDLHQDDSEAAKWKSLFQIDENEIVLLGGSTFAGEEIVLARIRDQLAGEGISIRLILAPRHVERVPAIVDELQMKGYDGVLRSKIECDGDSRLEKKHVILLDTIGELRNVYAAADLVFIGKSLCYIGGQNPIEPAAWGKAILFGENMQNFRDVSSLLLRANGARMISNEQELLVECRYLCMQPHIRQDMGQHAREVVLQNRGASDTIMDYINTHGRLVSRKNEKFS
ncbi:MAG: 3-deoxy-D-manno-octulosonic acid transferase [Candidatus Omnitrophota bacterium]|jgi:3-deoxy-D-manno-octulosonic-acid transferase|nr:MAG: 3-deoxy-D-manno-octulosonic acid transferase [Candidatus Omnitrophota bacterium]